MISITEGQDTLRGHVPSVELPKELLRRDVKIVVLTWNIIRDSPIVSIRGNVVGLDRPTILLFMHYGG